MNSISIMLSLNRKYNLVGDVIGFGVSLFNRKHRRFKFKVEPDVMLMKRVWLHACPCVSCFLPVTLLMVNLVGTS